MTVAEYLEQWRSTVVDPRLRPQTVVAYRSAIRTHLIPTLGHLQLASVTAMHIDRLYASLLKGGLSPTTLLKTHTILTSAFRRARRWRLIADNPMEDVDAPRRAPHETRVWRPGRWPGSSRGWMAGATRTASGTATARTS
jgi:integrase